MDINITKKVIINGVEYTSVDQVPPELRDVFLEAVGGQLSGATCGPIEINGKVYQKVEDLPPDVRKLYEGAMAVMGQKQGAKSGMSLDLGSVVSFKGGLRRALLITVGAVVALGLYYWFVK